MASGDFETAVKHANDAEALACAEIQVTDYGAASEPTYSIIVVLYQKHADLEEALGRLGAYAVRKEFELIFVNNGDFVADEVAGKCHRFRWIDVGFNYGCSGGRNLGARAARGDLLIFVDDDGIVEEHAIESLIDTITEHDAVAVRGRIRPKLQTSYKVSHYDLGTKLYFMCLIQRECQYGDETNFSVTGALTHF